MTATTPPTEPVEDWTTDYDIFDADYVTDPTPIWKDLRSGCPMARTDRRGIRSWLPTKYDDVQALAKIVPELSSKDPLVVTLPTDMGIDNSSGLSAPPISADPPEQVWTRRMILPAFAPRAVESHRQFTEDLCNRLIDGFIDSGECDGAVDYAQQIPPRVIAHMLGFDPEKADDFTTWVRGALELGLFDPVIRVKYRDIIQTFLIDEVRSRWENPRDDYLSELLALDVPEMKGREVQVVVGIANLLLIAGIDTTWSSIGSALFHMGTHPEDRRRLAADDTLFPTALEEMLRFYSPVTMARMAQEDVPFGDIVIKSGEKVLMNFPGANHDEDAFEDADKVLIDRTRNRHIAFGSGIHRCAGSNLARLEMDVALRTWFARIPEFEVSDPGGVTWAGGQVRGPRRLPVSF
ncbi:MAG: cytochrome P450 [Acidimicrobiales bacterium]|nr:cytochrome P450 [Acidimicrobiales bacterium]